MPRPPNIILIFADDLGYGDLGCDGGRIIRTPALDRMAREGVRFTDFYASANVCTPSRAGLLTGRYAIRSGLAHEVIQPSDTIGLPRSEVTIPQVLGPDCKSALIGKWHLGHVAPHWPPTAYGFDVFRGLPYSHDMRPLSLYRADGEHVEVSEARVDFARLTQYFFVETLAFAERHRATPFFITLALTAPHVPLRPNPDSLSGSPAGDYGEVVEEIDRNVAVLLERLRELGLEQDTLVIFTSDNGPWFEGSSGPFRDRKGGSAWDGGFRVPFILRQPGRVPAGIVTHALASNLDLLPTLAAMASRPLPGVELDGVDLSGVIFENAPSPREEFILFDNAHVAAIRTARWKYVVRSYYRRYDIDLGAFGYPLLFDLQSDPGENYSVARLYPEIAQDMKRRLDAARARYEPIAKNFPPYTPPPGAENHPD